MKCINCSNEAEYNYEYYSRAEYCKNHKNSHMIYKTENNCIIL